MSALPQPDPPERYVNASQLAELMGVSVKTIRKWTAVGCPHETWGMRAYRYLPSEVIAWGASRMDDIPRPRIKAADVPAGLAPLPARSQWGPDEAEYAAILDGDPCCYCGAPTEQIDHIVARITGGEHAWSNLTAACGRCNSSKGKKPVLLFLLTRRSA